jgi:hypothetical protein
MSIKDGKLVNGIGKIVNGKFVSVSLQDAAKPKPISDKERLARYRGERNEIDKEKRGEI